MKVNWALLGLLAGIGIGAFGQAFGVDVLIEGIRQHMVTIAVVAFAALALLLIAGILLERFFRETLKPRYESVSDVVSDATSVVGRAINLEDKDVEKASQIVRSGAAIYGVWSFRLLFLRTTIGVLIALGGAFATFVLIQQNDLLRGQSELLGEQNTAVRAQTTAAENQTDLLLRQLSLSEAQNDLMALNLVATLRQRLSREALRPSEVQLPEIEGEFFPHKETGLTCSLAQAVPNLGLYPKANPSELGAIGDLTQSASLGPRVVGALNNLVRDEDPSVAFAAFQLLDGIDGAEHNSVTLSNITAETLVILSDWHVFFAESALGEVICQD
ncbi:MAG: hypothetical protein AAFR50_04260, partial [Pseudomonadota bacterium]